MDQTRIRQIALELRKRLKQDNILVDVAILFGSYAKNKQTSESDIDIALVSDHFGNNRIKELSLVNAIASEIDSNVEVVTISLDKYLDPHSISPILNEIKKDGIVLF